MLPEFSLDSSKAASQSGGSIVRTRPDQYGGNEDLAFSLRSPCLTQVQALLRLYDHEDLPRVPGSQQRRLTVPSRKWAPPPSCRACVIYPEQVRRFGR